MSYHITNSKSLSALKTCRIKQSPIKKIHKFKSIPGTNLSTLKAKIYKNIFDKKKSLDNQSDITENSIPDIKFIPKTKQYIQLSPTPKNYDLKGKSTEDDIKSFNKIINYKNIIARATDVQNHLKGFLVKSSRKNLMSSLESLQKSERNKFLHPKSNHFLKEVKSGNINTVAQMLVDTPDLVKCSDSTNQTALHWACKRGHKDIVKFLIINKASTYAVDILGRLPEQIALNKGYNEIASIINGIKRKSRQYTIKQHISFLS
ncbi:hypothetical protein SteCoe_25015 [Stentor coeruleus]|uniref:Uncharacterized protein n=1 Tax=Stentor coeruleus TaxID=5963 RepID=A0A1R2BGC5_9CILI|nr:hypothetical protein SteCoe_25015 [Stentor coeruleus]